MKGTEYIRWAKEHAGLRYSLARSGTPDCTPDELGLEEGDVVLHGPDEDGWLPLREAIAVRYGVTPGGVALAHGTTLANHLVVSLLTTPGQEALVETPGYEPLVRLCELLGVTVKRFVRGVEASPAALIEAISSARSVDTRLVILSNPYNPCGTLLGPDALDALGDLAEVGDLHMLVDEVYLDLAPPPTGVCAASRHPRLLSTGSVTKSFGLGGVRLGWVLTDDHMGAALRRLNDLFTVLVAHPSERIAHRALQRADAILGPRRALLARNRQAVDRFIRDRPDLEWVAPQVGTVGWVATEGFEVDALNAVLTTTYGSAVAPGRFFGDPDRFRIGFGLPERDLREALERLGAALDELKG